MTNLITEARELCEGAAPGPWFNFGDWMIHTEPDVEHNGIAHSKTIGTVKAENADFIARSRTLIPELCDALGKAQEKNAQLVRELAALARESVEREKTLARLEAEVMARLEEHHEVN